MPAFDSLIAILIVLPVTSRTHSDLLRRSIRSHEGDCTAPKVWVVKSRRVNQHMHYMHRDDFHGSHGYI